MDVTEMQRPWEFEVCGLGRPGQIPEVLEDGLRTVQDLGNGVGA